MLAIADPHLAGVTENLQKILSKAPEYIEDVAQILDKAGKYLPTLVHIAEDPALPQVIDRIEALYAIEKKRKEAEAAATKTPRPVAVKRVGIGLDRVVKPLGAFVYLREHPWLPWVLGTGVIALVLGGGILIGRATKR